MKRRQKNMGTWQIESMGLQHESANCMMEMYGEVCTPYEEL